LGAVYLPKAIVPTAPGIAFKPSAPSATGVVWNVGAVVSWRLNAILATSPKAKHRSLAARAEPEIGRGGCGSSELVSDLLHHCGRALGREDAGRRDVPRRDPGVLEAVQRAEERLPVRRLGVISRLSRVQEGVKLIRVDPLPARVADGFRPRQ
jgi:hypothetical protein